VSDFARLLKDRASGTATEFAMTVLIVAFLLMALLMWTGVVTFE
jgi:hypothetical protein